MIIKSDAIEPKASSATSVYMAVIVDVSIGDGAFDNLQVFCPEVMSGTTEDAKNAINNWVEAPKKPHNGNNNINYNFQVGDVILISYQNGNVNSPQFVRYIPISDSARAQNKGIVENNLTPPSDTIFNINDTSITLESPGLQKGVALLEVLKASVINNEQLVRIYGFEKVGFNTPMDGSNILTIFKLGKYSTEIVLNHHKDYFFGDSNYDVFQYSYEANFDYYNKNGSYVYDKKISEYSFSNIVKSYLYKVFGDNLVDIVNETLKECGSSFNYDKTNVANIAYLYTNLAGYFSSIGNDDKNIYKKYDQTSLFFPDITKSKTTQQMPNNKDSAKYIVNAEAASGLTKGVTSNPVPCNIYHGYDVAPAVKKYSKNESRDIIKNFISQLWIKLCNNTDFDNKLASRYAIILSNSLIEFKTQAKKDIATNNFTLMLMVCLSTCYPILYKLLVNIDMFLTNFPDILNEDLVNFVNYIKDCLADETNKKIFDGSYDLAQYFFVIYYKLLGWDMQDDKIQNCFNESEKIGGNNAYAIKSGMEKIINYLIKHKEELSNKLKDITMETGGTGNPSEYGLVWPFPGVSNITSYFGMRKHPKTKKYKLHTGVDISEGGCRGKDIVAAATGEVVIAGVNGAYGNYIKIKHNLSNNITYTLYAHLKTINVKKGQQIQIGQKIGTCNSTGNSTGDHLHFEVRINGNNCVNPLEYVSSNNKWTPGIGGGNYNLHAYTDLTDQQIKDIACYVQQECGAANATECERIASQMCNLNETSYSSFRQKTGYDLHRTVTYGNKQGRAWYSRHGKSPEAYLAELYSKGFPNNTAVNAVIKCCKNGQRVLPQQVNTFCSFNKKYISNYKSANLWKVGEKVRPSFAGSSGFYFYCFDDPNLGSWLNIMGSTSPIS